MLEMTLEELKEYIKNMPDNTLLVVEFLEEGSGVTIKKIKSTGFFVYSWNPVNLI